MKNTLKVLLSMAIILIMTLSAFCLCLADTSASIGLSPKKDKYSIGETVTVTCTMSTDKSLYSYDCLLEYNSAVMQYVSGGVNGAGGVKWVEGISGEKSFSVKATFKTVKEGSCYFKFNGKCSDGYESFQKNSGWTVNVVSSTPTQKSTNANLSSLSVNIGALSPRFSANTTSYSVTVPYATSKITLSAKTQDAKAKLTGAGTYNLNVGKNTKSVTVTAESGAKKTYTVSITRQAQDNSSSVPVSSQEQPPVESNPNNPSDVNPASDPLLITDVNGVIRRIVPDASQMNIAAPTGFMPSSATLGSVSVNTFVESNGNNNYILYVTTDEKGEDPTYYYYTEEGYKRLAYMIVNNNTYIVENPVLSSGVPDGYYKSTANINNTTVTVFKFDEELMTDFCIMYCYLNGEYGYYRFDSYETTVQRAPDFTVLKEAKTSSDDLAQEKSLISDLIWRYKNMTVLGKIVVFAILLCAVLIIVTVIVLIVKLFKDKSDDDDEGHFTDDDDFDRDISSSEVTDDISDLAIGSIKFDNINTDTKPQDEIKEEPEVPELPEEPEQPEETPEISEQPPVEPIVEETKPSEEKTVTDDDDDDFADEESLKNLRGF